MSTFFIPYTTYLPRLPVSLFDLAKQDLDCFSWRECAVLNNFANILKGIKTFLKWQCHEIFDILHESNPPGFHLLRVLETSNTRCTEGSPQLKLQLT